MGDTYLITGGSGLIGGYVVKALVERGDEVVIFDIKPPGPKMSWILEPVWNDVQYIEGSISEDFPTLLQSCQEYKVDKIFHAAAIFRGQYELKHPYYSFHVNLKGMLNVCEAARMLHLGRIVFAGSNVEYAHLYQSFSKEPLTEWDRMFDPTLGISTYAAGKMTSTIIGMCYWKNQGVDWIGTRYTRVWGFGSKGPTSRNERIIEHAVNGLALVIPRDGNQKRNQCYVKDLAQGIIRALDADEQKLLQRVFNLGGADELADREIVAIIKELVPNAQIEVKGRGIDRRPIDSTAARQQLGWEPKWSFRSAVKDYIQNYTEFKKSNHHT